MSFYLLNFGLGLVLGLDFLPEVLEVGLEVPELAEEGGAVTGLGVGQPLGVIQLKIKYRFSSKFKAN